MNSFAARTIYTHLTGRVTKGESCVVSKEMDHAATKQLFGPNRLGRSGAT